MTAKPKQKAGKRYFSRNVDEICKELQTDPSQGLKQKESEARLEFYGLNDIPKAGKSLFKMYLAPIFNVFILILIVSAVILGIMQEWGTAGFTIIIISINSIVAVFQQFRAQKTLESLQKIAAFKATVLRKGSPEEILTSELVPGDIVLLNQGDKIPADGRLIESVNFSVNEAPLTGESVSVDKSIETLVDDKELAIQRQENMVFMGTFVATGRGKAVITTTGIETEIGKISKDLSETGSPDIPLTKKMNNFAIYLSLLVLSLLSITLIYKVAFVNVMNFYETNPLVFLIGYRNGFVDAMAIAMNLVPINLPLLTTIILITGVLNLAKSGVIIRNISAVEAMGRVSIVCSDKTGTITQNQMTVQKVWFNNKLLRVTGSGYDKEGTIYENGTAIELEKEPYFHLLLESGVLNNNASINEERVAVKLKGQKFKVVRRALGAPTEAALLVLAEKAGLDPVAMNYEYELLQEFSFDSAIKRMTTIRKTPKGDIQAFTKGASEIILDLSSSLVLGNKVVPLEKKRKAEIYKEIQKQAELGYRTLAIGYRPLGDLTRLKSTKAKKTKKTTESKEKKNLGADSWEDLDRKVVEDHVIFLGFVMILDPPRDGVREAVQSVEAAGITPVMITGDHPSTAKAIAEQMAIFVPGEIVVEGKHIKNLSKADFLKTAVFSRVSPKDKEVIVRKYQDEDRILVMTGDGVNDALALKNADVGVAMGINGTDIAKESADMVISDDNFTSIERGVRVGRGIYSRIRTIIYFFICIDLVEGIVFFSLVFSGLVSYTVIQHLFLILAVHSLPPLVLAFDPFPKDIMNEPPRDNEEIFNRNMLRMMLFQAAFMVLGYILAFALPFTLLPPEPFLNLNPALTVFDPLLSSPYALQKARTMCMNVIFISECTMIWSIRRPNTPVWKSIKEEFNSPLMFIISVVVYAQIGLTVFGGLRVIGGDSIITLLARPLDGLIDLYWMFLNPIDWLIVLGLSFQSIAALELFKWWAKRRDWFF